MYDKVVELLSRLEVKDGNYVASPKNLKIATEISQLMRGELLASDYTKYVTEFAREFDVQAGVSNKYFKSAFPEFKVSEMATATMETAKRNAVDLLLNRASDSEFISPLKNIIDQSVINNSGYSETLKNIRSFIQGDEETAGQLERYSRKIGRAHV